MQLDYEAEPGSRKPRKLGALRAPDVCAQVRFCRQFQNAVSSNRLRFSSIVPEGPA